MLFWASDRYTPASKSLCMQVNFVGVFESYLFTAASKFLVVVAGVGLSLTVCNCSGCAQGL
jgi:hypothetical protein